MNGYCTLKVYKNGASLQTIDFRSATGGANQYLANSGSIVVSANGTTDYFEMYCYQVTGSSQNTNGSGYQWSGSLIRAA